MQPINPRHATPAFSPDGAIKAVPDDCGIGLLEVKSGREIGRIDCAAVRPAHQVDEDGDGIYEEEIEELVTGFSGDGTLLWLRGNGDSAGLHFGGLGIKGLWDLATGRALSTPMGLSSWADLGRTAEASDAIVHRRIGTTGSYRPRSQSELFDLRSGKARCRLSVPGLVYAFRRRPGGRDMLVMCSNTPEHWTKHLPYWLITRLGVSRPWPKQVDGIAIVDTLTGRSVATLDGIEPSSTSNLLAAEYSPDGRTLVTWDTSGSLRLWGAPGSW